MLLDDTQILQRPVHLPAELIQHCLKGDVLLVCKDRKAVQCHSHILAMASGVIRDMLDSTEVCKNGGDDGALVVIPFMDDEAAHWLQALLHLYPLATPVAGMTPGQAVAVALLAHKYNIPKLATIFEQYVTSLQHANPYVGHYKWVIPNFHEQLKYTSVDSPVFRAVGSLWRLQLLPKFDGNSTMSSLSVLLGLVSEGCGVTDEKTVTCSSIALVSQADPVAHSHVSAFANRRVYNSIIAPVWAWPDAVTANMLRRTSLGYVKDGTVEFQLSMTVESPFGLAESGSEGRFLSADPEDDLYVFKWLELAWRLENAMLEEKCMEYLSCTAYQAVFSQQFGKDLHEAAQSMAPGEAFNIIRNI